MSDTKKATLNSMLMFLEVIKDQAEEIELLKKEIEYLMGLHDNEIMEED